METIAKTLLCIFTTFGFPRIIQSDNGTEFVNRCVKALTEASLIDHRLITPYHPQANGAAERTVQTVKNLLKKLLQGNRRSWDFHIPFIQYAINLKIAHRHRSSPFAIMFNRIPNEFANFDAERPITEEPDEKSIAESFTLMNETIFPIIELLSKAAGKKYTRNGSSQKATAEFPVGSYVMIKNHTKSTKLDEEFLGPYRIIKRNPNNKYTLESNDKNLLPRDYLASELKPLSSDYTTGQESYEIEAILNHKKTRDGMKYLVKWKGYDESENSWEPASNFDSTSSIEDYWKRRNTISS